MLLVLCATLLAVPPVDAQTAGPVELEPVAIETFFDAAWRDTLSSGGVVPGAIVAVVQDGKILLNKGFGVVDADTGEPADAGTTRIRIGSVSKIFSALTALALVDAGRIELDRDVNDYLTSITVPDTFDEPITLRALLSHQGGFDSGMSGYTSFDNTAVATPEDVYERRLIRVRPPNRGYAYDNLGVGLMGHLVGVVNGTSFARAVEEHVAAPLGLRQTTMGVPDVQLQHLAACHTWDASGARTRCVPKFMREGFQAAGDITTTGADMARLMLALLNGGCLDGRCVLEPRTFEALSDPDVNRLHPRARGLGFIMYEKDGAGRPAMGHDGGQDGFTSSLIFFPASKTGVFISLFSFVGVPVDWRLSEVLDLVRRGRRHDLYGALMQVERKFAETFLPEPVRGTHAVLAGPAPVALEFLEGTYVPTQRAGAMLLDRMLEVAEVLDVVVRGSEVWIDGNGPYVHAGGGVLESKDGGAQWLFTRDGPDVFLQQPSKLAFDMYVRKPWHWDARVTVLPLALPIVLALPALVFAIATGRARPTFQIRGDIDGRSPAAGYLVAFAGAAVFLGMYLELEHFGSHYYPEGATPALIGWRLLLNLGWLAAAAALWVIVRSPRDSFGVSGIRAAARSCLVALFAVSALVVVILLPYWGMVGNLWRP